MAELKNWLIKKLGGYTEKEFIERLVDRFEVFTVTQRDIETLRVDVKFDLLNSPPQDWIEDRAVHELAKKIKPFVRWETCESYLYAMDMTKVVRAYVKVVKDNG